jgi:SAM-dependent methyltransferase
MEEMVAEVYGEDYFDINKDEGRARDIAAMIGDQLDRLEAILGRRGTVLDVGCGDGSFLRMAIERGWKGVGTDIRINSAARSVDAPLYDGPLGRQPLGAAEFDLIRFNHVLEHTPDPVAELRVAHRLLRDDGLLFVSVPNIGGIPSGLKSVQSRLRLKSRVYQHYAAGHHLFFFTPSTLKTVLAAAGFEVRSWETPVLKRHNRSALSEVFNKLMFEKTRTAAILDFYSTKKAP